MTIILTLLFLITSMMYFLPTIINIVSNLHAGDEVFTKKLFVLFTLNLFFGWTLIGWILLLFWSVTGDEKKKDISGEVLSDISMNQLRKAKEKLDFGLITPSEYDEIKRNLSKYIK